MRSASEPPVLGVESSDAITTRSFCGLTRRDIERVNEECSQDVVKRKGRVEKSPDEVFVFFSRGNEGRRRGQMERGVEAGRRLRPEK